MPVEWERMRGAGCPRIFGRSMATRRSAASIRSRMDPGGSLVLDNDSRPAWTAAAASDQLPHPTNGRKARRGDAGRRVVET
jgi:hypothetical protein